MTASHFTINLLDVFITNKLEQEKKIVLTISSLQRNQQILFDIDMLTLHSLVKL